MSTSLESFLTTYDDYRTAARRNSIVPQDLLSSEFLGRLQEMLDEIKEQWKITTSYSVAAMSRSDEFSADSLTESLRPLATLFRTASDPGSALGTFIREKLEEVAREIQASHAFLGATVQERGDSLAGSQVTPIAQISSSEPSTLASDRYWMPYRLRLRSDEAARWLSRIEAGQAVGLADVLNWYAEQQQVASPHRAEVLLAMAYLYVASRQWLVANEFNQLALDAATETETRHEALFLQAFCTRMHAERDGRSYARALDIVKRLQNEQAERGEQDPRVLREFGTIILLWNEASADPRYRAGATPPPDGDEGVNVLEAALGLLDCTVQANLRLRADILNNLCYFVLERGEEGDPDSARSYLTELEQTVRQVSAEDTGWDALITDTMAWAKWRLCSLDNDADALDELIAMFQHTLQYVHKSDPGEDEVQAHLETVKRARSALS
jgi:hypothetical protein